MLASSTPAWSTAIQLIAIVISCIASFFSAMMLYQLKSHSDRMTSIETDVKKFACQKADCAKDFVDKVDYIRNVTRSEKQLEELLKGVAGINATLDIIDKLPAICGAAAREIAKEIKKQ